MTLATASFQSDVVVVLIVCSLFDDLLVILLWYLSWQVGWCAAASWMILDSQK
jgi:hypothetical protein